jgi:hypothetical protein
VCPTADAPEHEGGGDFSGHAGQLDLTVANPQIRISGAGSASLIATLTSKDLSGSTTTAGGTAIATLDLGAGAASSTDGTLAWSGVPATLTAAGASAFGGFYSAGTALDPVSFVFPLGSEMPCDAFTDAGSAGALASTGADARAGVEGLVAGALLLLLGAGLVAIRRRTRRAA